MIAYNLSDLLIKLREEQAEAVNVGVAHLLSSSPGHEGSLLLASPTGTGKSYIQGAIHRVIREQHGKVMYTTFPSFEIALGVWTKAYGTGLAFGCTEAQLTKYMQRDGLWTIKKLHNELVKGSVPIPDFIAHDEAHHSTDDTHELTHAICGLCPRVGLTATDYRGTAVESTKLRERWPRMHRVLTLKKAVDLGRLSMPTWNVWPLLNDELIDVTNGEFSVRSIDSHVTNDLLTDLVSRIGAFWQVGADATPHTDSTPPCWDKPTMIAVPGVGTVHKVVDALNAAGYFAVGVTGETSVAERQIAFDRCVKREAVLVQIRVVGEGVDLPIRRLIDLAPTMSPVLWMQRVGRITRPVGAGELAPDYICCCHNLARHAYLWYGVMPATAVRDAQKAWGDDYKPSRRVLARAVDVEGLGRFEPAALPLADGSFATLYTMQTKDGLNEYAVLLHPLRPDPWFFQRENILTGNMAKKVVKGFEIEYKEKSYGKWRGVKVLPQLKGCISVKLTPLQPAQQDWWNRSAAGLGLDVTAAVTNREFQAVPILLNSRTRLEV